MTTQYVDADIRSDEGFRANAYPDPVSHGDPWTIGYGCTGEGIAEGAVWSLAQAAAEQSKRRAQCEAQLDHALTWWRTLNDARQDVLVNWTYNQGFGHVLGFHHALAAMQTGDWIEAKAQMLDSLWARQVGRRATRLAEQMLAGERIDPATWTVD